MITDMKNAKIFSPLQLGRTTLKNRIAMAPMSMHYEATNGTVPKQLADIFVRRAEGGAGYVVIDAVTVDHKYWYIGKTTALDKDSLVPQFAAFAKRVSDAGSTLIPQIIHPGPESICALKGITPLGPSVNTNANGAVSRPITIDEIHKVVKQYGQAARRAEEAGCGGIALHCAHAYMLPGAFLSPLRNKRMDEYGGCIDNRARLILEIIEECRRNISRDFPIVLRVSGSEREPGGNSLDEMLYLAPKFEAAGVDMLEVSGGVQYEGLQNILPSHSQKIGMNVYEASEIKKVVNIPVFVVGKINDVRYAADLVERGLVDGVSMGRPLLADPDLPKKALENRFDDITPCGSCGGRCITPEDPHHPVCKCHINPLVGHEYDFPFNPTDKPRKVLIIGAGPGGMYTAVTAAERGHDVTVWEKSKQIGGQLNLAVVSPGKQEMCKWLTHLACPRRLLGSTAGVSWMCAMQHSIASCSARLSASPSHWLNTRSTSVASISRLSVIGHILHPESTHRAKRRFEAARVRLATFRVRTARCRHRPRAAFPGTDLIGAGNFLPVCHRPQRFRVDGGQIAQIGQLVADALAIQDVRSLPLSLFFGQVFFQTGLQLADIGQPDYFIFLSHLHPPFCSQ